MNPCLSDNPCAPTALCTVRQHTAACHCPPGLIGAPDPTVACERPPTPHFNVTRECYYDSDCADGLACLGEDTRCGRLFFFERQLKLLLQ